MKNIFFLILLTSTISAFGQKYTLPNEEVIFSFDTKNGKKVTLNKDKNNKYIIYRFGTESKIEFEYPDKLINSWKCFKYSFYLRGGGLQNEGMDLNYICFTNKNYKYVIYDSYFADGNKHKIGIKIIDITTDKTTDIRGNNKTRKGNMIDFRDNNLLEIGDELFD